MGGSTRTLVVTISIQGVKEHVSQTFRWDSVAQNMHNGLDPQIDDYGGTEDYSSL